MFKSETEIQKEKDGQRSKDKIKMVIKKYEYNPKFITYIVKYKPNEKKKKCCCFNIK